MTIEQHLKAQFGELMWAIAVGAAERDSLKVKLDAIDKVVAPVEAKKE